MDDVLSTTLVMYVHLMWSWHLPTKPHCFIGFLDHLSKFHYKEEKSHFGVFEVKKKRTLGLRTADTLVSWQWWILWMVLMWRPLDRHRCWSAVLIRFSPLAWTFRMELGIGDPSQCLTCGLHLPIVPLWCIRGYYIHLFKGELKLGSSL
jgi:hypothetical protein